MGLGQVELAELSIALIVFRGKFGAKRFPDKINSETSGCGEMAEWLKARASKACIPLRVSGVRIPLSPPELEPVMPKPHGTRSRRTPGA
jgi:hypothetical protein